MNRFACCCPLASIACNIDDTALVETMAAVSDSFEAHGYRRMQAALRHRGFVVNHKRSGT